MPLPQNLALVRDRLKNRDVVARRCYKARPDPEFSDRGWLLKRLSCRYLRLHGVAMQAIAFALRTRARFCWHCRRTTIWKLRIARWALQNHLAHCGVSLASGLARRCYKVELTVEFSGQGSFIVDKLTVIDEEAV